MSEQNARECPFCHKSMLGILKICPHCNTTSSATDLPRYFIPTRKSSVAPYQDDEDGWYAYARRFLEV